MSDNALYFDRATIKNFKNIPSKIVEINGRSIAIIGGNNKGKSSLLQALRSVVDSKYIPSQPITEGEERGEIEVIVSGTLAGEKEKYKISTYFTPGNQRGAMTIADKDGNVKTNSVRTMVDTLMGKISFSPEKFMRDSFVKQVKAVKEVSGKEKEIDAVLDKIEQTKKKASFEKEKYQEQETLLKNHGFSQEEIKRYSVSEPVERIEKALADIGPAMEKWATVESGITERKSRMLGHMKDHDRATTECHDNLSEISRLKGLIKKLQDRNTEIDAEAKTRFETTKKIEAEIASGEKWLKENTKPSNAAIAQKLSDARAHNENHKKLEEFKDKQKVVMAGKDKHRDLIEDIKTLQKECNTILESSALPVKDLTIGEGQLLYKGLPFEEGQINTQTMLEVCEELTMAHNPNLRVIFIDNGSLYDKPSLTRLVEKGHAKGYRFVVEVVDFAAGEMEVKFIEEYLSE